MTALHHLNTLAPDARTALAEAMRAYLTNRENRGQFDRAQGFDTGHLEATSARLLKDGLEGQQREIDTFSPLFNEHLRRPPARILDAGTGLGHAAIALAGRYPDSEVIGCEVEPEALRVAELLATPHPRISFRHCPIELLPEPDGSFDLIYFRSVLEHVDDPRKVLHRLVALLAPGGTMLLTTPNYLFPREHHIPCWMLPGGPKFLVKIIARSKGLDSSFVDHLRLEVNTVRVKRWLREAGDVDWVDLNHSKINEILRGNADGVHNPGLVRLLKRFHLASITAGVLTHLPLTPSVLLLVQKRQTLVGSA